MSNSLVIDVPNVVKQNTPLRNVPSGSTAEPDYSVKYTPQTLTEEQKAQARANIGAAAAGEGGGATINEFVYREWEDGPTSGIIDCEGYEPKEGDLMIISFQGSFHSNDNQVTLNNGTTNPTVTLLNAEVNATDYDEISPEVNTKWTVRLTKVNDAWVAVNISTQVQADWNTSDSTMPSYIKNKPTISNPDVIEDMTGSLTFYTNGYGQIVQFNNGSYMELLAGSIVKDGVYTSYPNKTHSWYLGCKTTINIPINPNTRTRTGYFRFYPQGKLDYMWLHTSNDWVSNSNHVILAEPFYQDLNCKDANIVLNSIGGMQWNLYNINHTTSQNIDNFHVWTVNNTLWKGIWDGTGNVVMFDTDAYYRNEAEVPTHLINFYLYVPQDREPDIIEKLKSDFGESAVEDYIVPKIHRYKFIYSEGFKYKIEWPS